VNAVRASVLQPVAAAAAAEAAARASTQRVADVISLRSFLPKQTELEDNTPKQTEMEHIAAFRELAA
jgi:hypothetical protein